MERAKIVLALMTLLAAMSIAASGAGPRTVTVCPSGCDYTKIQTAINNVLDGDRILVYNGTYSERITVYHSIELLGENKYGTILEGDQSCEEGGLIYEVVRIYKDNVNISGFTVRNGFMGISLHQSNQDTITDNIISGHLERGLSMIGSHNNTIEGNIILENSVGLYSHSSDGNLIYNNIFQLNDENALDLGNNRWNTSRQLGTNILGGPYLGGNSWSDYQGIDNDGSNDQLGDTQLVHNSGGSIALGGDWHPLTQCAYLEVQADRHVVGSGNYPEAGKHPIADMSVMVFNKTEILDDGLSASWHNYKTIWTNYSPLGIRFTDSTGYARFNLPAGDYIVISRYSNTSDGYPEPQVIYPGVSASNLACGETMHKYIQVIEKVTGEKVPAKYTKKTGSALLIIEPEYIEWDSTSELYPFIFDSVGDWNITTLVYPPEGFVADADSLFEEVLSELEAVQFNITDVGSDWVDTLVTHEVKHKGKKEIVKTKIGVKRKKGLEKRKDGDRPDPGEKKPYKNTPEMTFAPLQNLPTTTLLSIQSPTTSLLTTTTTALPDLNEATVPTVEVDPEPGLKQKLEKLFKSIFG
jgi:parallel beta-helix repeat protein